MLIIAFAAFFILVLGWLLAPNREAQFTPEVASIPTLVTAEVSV